VKQRARWISVGLGLRIATVALFVTTYVLRQAGIDVPPSIAFWVRAVSPAPFVIAYALSQSRIVDARFFGGRAAVYGVLAAIPVGILGLIDWLVGKYLASTTLGVFVEAAATVVIAFGLNAIHHRVESFVEELLFRDRRRGERQIAMAISSLPCVSDGDTVSAILSHDTGSAMPLASAAVFLRDGEDYVRAASVSWDGFAEAFAANDRLVLALRSTRQTVALEDVHNGDIQLPQGYARPDVVIPILIGGEVSGFAAYGRLRDGERLDPSQVELLVRLGDAAAFA
jgi:hypothetical protein